MKREEYIGLPWRKDRITREYAEEHFEELRNPRRTSYQALTEALTYCASPNPFGDEVLRRGGEGDEEIGVLRRDVQAYMKAVRSACMAKGIRLY